MKCDELKRRYSDIARESAKNRRLKQKLSEKK